MPPDRHPDVTEDADLLAGLLASWPVPGPDETRGYRPLDLRGTRPLAVADLGAGRHVVVVGRDAGWVTALPCVHDGSRWRVAAAGDGVAAAVLARLERSTWALPFGFSMTRFDDRRSYAGDERDLGTDQSNISVVVGDEAIVKWRTAPDADGRRATRLRRHLQANGFRRTPPLLASLAWTDAAGRSWVLADVDALRPGAEDGWDHYIATLRSAVESPGTANPAVAEALGHLTAGLHTALLRPSEIVPHPTRPATPAELAEIRASGLQLVERALAIAAEDQHEVEARVGRLRHAIEGSPVDGATLGLIHGDLHLGQLVAWRDGLDVIDFDGPPEPTAPAGDFDVPVRDVAQMLCSLWSLAAVVDQRTGSRHAAQLRAWATAAEDAFLDVYRRDLSGAAAAAFDPRLLEPLMAEQLCRELLYAEATLPRWRYAPLQVLRWRYPLEDRHD